MPSRAQSSGVQQFSVGVDAPVRRPPKTLGNGRLAFLLLLGMGAVTIHPSSRLMASSNGNGANENSVGGDSPGENSGSGQSQQATLKAAAAADVPFSEFDPASEQILLTLANQSRAEAHLPALTLDAGLNRAARLHAQAMVTERKLSHQFEGEPSLPQRLANATRIQLDREGENVAFDFNAENGHAHLMQSPPHRANLLNAAYNVVGLGVIKTSNGVYIVQDFGHALPNYSSVEVKDRVAGAVVQQRHQLRQPDLAHRELPGADAAACSMAQADKLNTASVHQLAQRYTLLTYTSLHPEALPAEAAHALAARNLHSYSVGACYARTETYPTGAYWVVLALE